MPSSSPSVTPTCDWPFRFLCVMCTGFWALDPLDAAADRGGKSTSRSAVLAGGLASASSPSSSSGLKEPERSVRDAIARSWRLASTDICMKINRGHTTGIRDASKQRFTARTRITSEEP